MQGQGGRVSGGGGGGPQRRRRVRLRLRARPKNCNRGARLNTFHRSFPSHQGSTNISWQKLCLLGHQHVQHNSSDKRTHALSSNRNFLPVLCWFQHFSRFSSAALGDQLFLLFWEFRGRFGRVRCFFQVKMNSASGNKHACQRKGCAVTTTMTTTAP